MSSIERVVAYHEASKHHFNRYAPGPGHLDWANQPSPFRRFEGAPVVKLSLAFEDAGPPFALLYDTGVIPSAEVSLASISRFFEHSLALSAWKVYGDSRWALRVNPSSGNLHPTEGYVILGRPLANVRGPAAYHYAPAAHALECRCRFPPATWEHLTAGLPSGAFLVGLSSIHWREAWKYGERSYRYCQHDVGHAIGSLRYSAAMLGWRMCVLEDLGDAQVSALLGLDRDDDFAGAEREEPDLLAAVIPGCEIEEHVCRPSLPEEAFAGVAQGLWTGRANRLSAEHRRWADAVEAVEATRKLATGFKAAISAGTAPQGPPGGRDDSGPSARQIVLQRRSATAFDGATGIPAEKFFAMLSRLMPNERRSRAPWDCLSWRPRVHPAFFVHRVEKLPPGLYVLVRDADQLDPLRGEMSKEFAWRRPDGCPEELPFYVLAEGDVRRTAGGLSLGQDIAADGAFSLGMLAEFESSLREYGAWFYRCLFWEAGLIGQVLYLEAEAAGLRGTGIGAFFDDSVHECLGIERQGYQTLYHFTVGHPVEDTRLSTEPPYEKGGR